METTIIQLLKDRKASRAFAKTIISDQVITTLMNATQLSASCRNNQSWRFLFLTEEPALEKGRKALSEGNSWAKKAPLLIIGFSKPDLDCQMKDGTNLYLFDLGMATQLILLQATELNLVARPMVGFSPQIVRDEFLIPADFDIVIVIAVGYEGNINELDERLQKISSAPRVRMPINNNFFLNKIEYSVET
jgi:glutaredoxin-dependent peroxiredoxin